MMSLLGPVAAHSGRSHHGDGAGHGFSTSSRGFFFPALVGTAGAPAAGADWDAGPPFFAARFFAWRSLRSPRLELTPPVDVPAPTRTRSPRAGPGPGRPAWPWPG